jgi:hypothetical protein
MEVGAPNSEPGSNGHTGDAGGSGGMTLVSDQILAVWLSGAARKSRGMRPGLT